MTTQLARILNIPITGMSPILVGPETVSITAGAAGTLVNCYLARKPILDANNSYIGYDSDTSLVLTSTAFTNEIPTGTPDANMSNGDYWVDYITGRIRGKKADTSTSMTASYYVFKDLTDAEWSSLLDTKATSNRIQVSNKGGFNICIDKATGDTAATASGWIEDEKYGAYLSRTATAVSAEFDTAVQRTGRCTLKLSTTDATGRAGIIIGGDNDAATYIGTKRLLIPIKASTKYRFICYVKTVNAATNSVYGSIRTINSSMVQLTANDTNKLSGTNDWTLITKEFTSDATASYFYIKLLNIVAGNVSDAYFDVNSMQLLEIGTDSNNANAYPAQIKPILVANNDLTGISNVLDESAAYANTYALTTGVDEGATHRQTITPIKKKLYKIGIYIVDKGTGNWNIDIHDASNNLIGGGIAVANASLTSNAWNYFNVGLLWTSGNIHVHAYSSVADGTLKTNTSNDMEDASYILLYAKNSEGSLLIANGISTNIISDRDGLLTGSIINLESNTYEYYSSFASYPVERITDIYARNGNDRLLTANTGGMTSATTVYPDLKVNTIFPINKTIIRFTTTNQGAGETMNLQLSTDGINWTTVQATADASGTWIIETDKITSNIFFIRFLATAGTLYISSIYIRCYLDTSSAKLPIFYPINSIIQESRSVKLRNVATRVYFRTQKFQNDNKVVQPCLEFMDSSGAISYGVMFLDFDNSQETNPSVNINISNTTNAQQSGTGSADSTTGYILNDGEYMTLSSAEDDLKVTYKVGYGTTFNNPTKNAYYISSLANSSDSTQDPSFQSEFVIGNPQKNIAEELADLRRELTMIKQCPNMYNGILIGSGTDYTLTTSLAVISFGTSGNLEMRLPKVGTYEITADINCDLSGITASAAANYSLYKLYKDGVAITNTERKGVGFPILAAELAGINSYTLHFSWIVRVETPNSLISIYAKQNSATTGNWLITSGATGITRMGFKRLGN